MDEKVIVITGTRKGLGKALAEYYLSKGNKVAGCSRRGGSIVNDNYEHFAVDVSDEKQVMSMFRSVKKKWGKVDILINNAGLASMNHLLLTPVKTIDKLTNTNLKGTFICSREAAKIMMSKKNGHIINFSTVAVPLNLDGEAIYAATKSAVESLTKVSAKELSEFGITVNAVGPTPIQTDLIKNVPKDKLDELLEKQAIKRFGEIDDVINVIDFFIKPESNFITGQVIYLGGVSKG